MKGIELAPVSKQASARIIVKIFVAEEDFQMAVVCA
jgi:hypothetical protein